MNTIIALGGGNEIGASSYFLQVEGVNILLDCGLRLNTDNIFPDYSCILNKFIESFWDLDGLILSHAHYDHIGALPYIISNTKKLKIFSTPQTKQLTKLQLLTLNKLYTNNEMGKLQKEIQIDRAIEMIQPIPYRKKINSNKFDLVFYNAGHMAGAAMSYIKIKNHNILYTGDFSDKNYPSVPAYCLDESIKFDTVIVCGTHAYNPHNTYKNDFNKIISDINNAMVYNNKVYVHSPNLTKGIEIASMLDIAIENFNLPKYKIYLDDDLEKIANSFEDMNYMVFSKNVKYLYSKQYNNSLKEIIISNKKTKEPEYENYKYIDANKYTLHINYNGLKKFILSKKPKNVFVVHTQPKNTENLIKELSRDLNFNCSITLLENNKTYNFK